MPEKPTHFGRAGEFFTMSELLLRGWNVAVLVVDVGDDVFVIDDNDKTTYRMQVKPAASDTSQYVFQAFQEATTHGAGNRALLPAPHSGDWPKPAPTGI